MQTKSRNSFGARDRLTVDGASHICFRLNTLQEKGWNRLDRFPVSTRILLENLLRHEDGGIITADLVESVLASFPSPEAIQIPFMPSRVLLQDFTGVPAVVDLAAMRSAVQRMGGDPERINPLVPSDLVIDHSIQVDCYGSPDAFGCNIAREYERNKERYSLLRWAQSAFHNFTVAPPGRGIVHQVNLEYLASVVRTDMSEGDSTAFPDTLVGTDSHTTMINGLGVLGWGVGGIEAEAVMLGQPYYFPLPQVVGVRLLGELPPGVTATDLVLAVTQKLREKGVVGKFVEFFGPGAASLSLPDRATLANMAPEYGATMGFFAVDEGTLDYLQVTGRDSAHIRLVEAYTKEQGLFGSSRRDDTLFSDLLDVDLAAVEPALAGPKRPQDRIPLSDLPRAFHKSLREPPSRQGFGLSEADEKLEARVSLDDATHLLNQGSVVIAAITSCTNTSNPALMIAAGLLAQKALERGVRSKPWVKTSLAPGSRVVTQYLNEAGLTKPLEAQGFHLVGYGCTTCIGNSGPLPEPIQNAVEDQNLVVASVLSGNRNFEGRIHGATRANYLASPPLVVAYALAGRIDFDFQNEPLGRDASGNAVFLTDLWPRPDEVRKTMSAHVRREQFSETYGDIYSGDDLWRDLPVPEGKAYAWDPESSYIRMPPFFENLGSEPMPPGDIDKARVLLFLGDSVTTDHISPAGAIPPDSPAGQYLQSKGVPPDEFNSYGSRRGNHEVMIRGTFANIRIRNRLVEGVTGGYTRHFPDGEQTTVWEAARQYRKEGVPLVVLAGKEYGTGSSRDWAAKGTALLGVRAVVAQSYERIHRSNLIGMGVLPLQFRDGESAESLGLTGEETFSIVGVAQNLQPGQTIQVEAVDAQGRSRAFSVVSRLDTSIEVDYYRHGGILPKVLRELMKEA